MAWSWREWVCGTAGASVAVALWLGWRDSCGGWLALVGCAWLARWLASTASLWLAPALPRRLIPDLRRRAVFVTGCDSGFGHAAALRLDAQGVGRVFAGVLLPQGAGALALRDKASPRLSLVPLDVTDAASVTRARALVEEQLLEHKCELWAIVNNAGVLAVGESEWMDIEDLKKAFEVNVVGQIRVAQAFLPLLKKSRGRVVNVNSAASRFTVTGLSPYTISKHASLAFTESLKVEMLKCSVSVHSIEPGIYMTPIGVLGLSLTKEKLESIPEEILKTYEDSRYAEKTMKLIKLIYFLTSKPHSKASEVAAVIEDACLSDDPQDVYLPGERSKLINALNTTIQDFQGLILKLIYKFL